ncbi:MAG: threonylcarbamoyl-AMP synthase [Bacteroidales bacterium]|nr:threonylcarbamoyl-AMP synthase [Bacteroidales bacterium]
MIDDINNALRILKQGGVILYPTDTVWGIGCDATDEEAVSKIYNIKKREDSRSMIILIHSEAMIGSYVNQVPDVAWELVEASLDPLTIIYPGARNLARNVIGDDGTIGIRITPDEFCSNLIRRFKKPLVSTSANISGKKSPANFYDIDPDLLELVDYVVKWRQDDPGGPEPSSIIKLGTGGEVEIIRK